MVVEAHFRDGALGRRHDVVHAHELLAGRLLRVEEEYSSRPYAARCAFDTSCSSL
jgi:hypothetical protein